MSRRRNFVPHHEACHGEEGLQGVGRGHQGQDPALPLQRRKGQDGSDSSAQFTQEQGSIKVKAGQQFFLFDVFLICRHVY